MPQWPAEVADASLSAFELMSTQSLEYQTQIRENGKQLLLTVSVLKGSLKVCQDPDTEKAQGSRSGRQSLYLVPGSI